MSIEHTQQKTFCVFNSRFQAFEVKFDLGLMQMESFLSHFIQPSCYGNL